MKKSLLAILILALTTIGCSINWGAYVFAEEDNGNLSTSISITPVSNIISLSANNTYDYSFRVTNGGSSNMDFEVYAAPYSYTYSETDDEYRLGFAKENNYTQITRWISFKDSSGNYVEKPTFTAGPNETVEVFYRIETPGSLPAGGQYAVIFAHTLSGSLNASGIKTEASPGLIVYGRATGETIRTAEISNMSVSKDFVTKEGNYEAKINATSKIKNTGNVDFTATGSLTVRSIFGNVYYESDSTTTAVSVIPETELSLSDQWDDTPFFGLFNATWRVSAAGEDQEISSVILIMPISIIIIMLILLTVIIIWIIIIIRKRKERRSRFMV